MEVKAPWSQSVSKWQSQVPVGIFWYVTYLRAVAFNFRTFLKNRGHLTLSIWLKFGMMANFRVITTNWVLKSSSCFCLAKNR